MRAITLKAPWSWAVCRLGKRVENRAWHPTPAVLAVGDWFAIHGGKTPRGHVLEGVFDLAQELAVKHRHLFTQGDDPKFRDAVAEGIVAVCQYGGLVTEPDPWWDGPPYKGWRLRNVRVLPEPIPCRGAQGLWNVPPDIEAKIREVLKCSSSGS